ncbi:MAG: CHAT domain-containing protein [Myxococcales bacterium]|nr:CHAT domain-containing protein [Myxococcales bacterium]
MATDPPTAVLHGERLLLCRAQETIWRFDAECTPRLSVWPPPPTGLRVGWHDDAGERPVPGEWRGDTESRHYTFTPALPSTSGWLVLGGERPLARWRVEWSAPPVDHAPLKAAMARRAAHDHEGALALLDGAGALDDEARLWALELCARLHRDRGALGEAASAWEAGAALAMTLEMPGEAARRYRAAAFIDLVRRLFTDAERRAERARAALGGRDHPPDVMLTAYLDGLLAEARADHRGAARHLGHAHRLATRLDAPQRAAIEAQLGLLELRLGRVEPARALLDRPLALDGLHERVHHRLQRAWLACHEHLAHGASGALDRALAEVDAARAQLPAGVDPRLAAGCHLSAGWIALLAGRLQSARAAHDAAELLHRQIAASEPGADFLTPSRALLDGRLCLAEGDAARARDVFNQQLAAARDEQAGLPSPQVWAALHGRGRARRALGDIDGALADHAAALAELDRAVIDIGRDRVPSLLTAITLLDTPAQLVDDRIDLLDARDRRAAFAEVDAAAVRRQRTLDTSARIARLPPAVRAIWTTRIERLSHRSAEHDRLRQDWTLAPAARAPLLEAARAAVREAFDDAVRLLDAHAPTAALVVDPDALIARLGPGEAVLACHRRADRRVESWWLHRGVMTRAIDRPLAEVVADGLAGVEHLHVITGGVAEAWALPEHPFAGRPLAACVGLGFMPHARLITRPQPTASGPVSVLADPEGDLPRARADGRWLAERLGAPLLLGDAVTREAAFAALSDAAALHFAGHGEPELHLPEQSCLRLALDQTLHAEDVIALGRAPARIVLQGCATGMGFGTHAMSLPTACLMAGATSVLATVAPIDSEEAGRFVRRLYEHGGLWQPGPALRAATAESVAAGDPGWRSWRLLGQP